MCLKCRTVVGNGPKCTSEVFKFYSCICTNFRLFIMINSSILINSVCVIEMARGSSGNSRKNSAGNRILQVTFWLRSIQ